MNGRSRSEPALARPRGLESLSFSKAPIQRTQQRRSGEALHVCLELGSPAGDAAGALTQAPARVFTQVQAGETLVTSPPEKSC